ncbi:YceI family protein [Balneolaceae bacterium YR4-1]|uniref:YceI family protein n=1 Tax=Halalkalibaculum roseum TaxID=2709311 RepID=A0A6M1T386_9BACT|nr:YceI family protein [Halalkalibaculum roseum]NGP76465.1 YceI family protein [Halalkalibaculum roseum]
MKRLLLTILTFCFLTSDIALSQAFKTESGNAEFKSSVPLHSFAGTSDNLVGRISLQDSTVDFYLDLATLDTGNGKRDKDMRKTLETDKYPFAEFYGKVISGFDPDSSNKQDVTVQGSFTIHDVSREVTINGTLQMRPEGLLVEADWVLNMTNYNIKPPGILFYRVEENIDIQIEALLKPQNS